MFHSPAIRARLPLLPPPGAVSSGGADTSLRTFAYSGAGHYACMDKALKQLGYSWGHFDSILDFGCGYGRMARLFARHSGPYTGIDIMETGPQWLSANMEFGRFLVGPDLPPLNEGPSSFDAIFGISVFTHLTESSQQSWLEEFARLLQPGGLLIQTVHGRHAVELCRQHQVWRDSLAVPPGAFERLDEEFSGRGFAWVPHAGQAGALSEHYGISAQSVDFIREHWCRDFELLGIWSGAIDGWQDIVILRRLGATDRPRVTPVLPVFPQAGAGEVGNVALQCSSSRPWVGVPVRFEASATGRDIHYRFSVREEGDFFRAITDWSPDPRASHTFWTPGEYGMVVHAASGPGDHFHPAGGAGVAVTALDRS